MRVSSFALLLPIALACSSEKIQDHTQGGSGRQLIASEPAPSSGGQVASDTTGGGGAPTVPSTVGSMGESTVFVDDGTIAASDLEGLAGAGNCIEVEVEVEKAVPTVVLLIDRSGSMQERFGMDDRWNTLRDVLLDPAGILAARQQDIRFGVSFYKSENGLAGLDEDGLIGGMGGNANDPAVCPIMVDVAIALNNFQAISDVYAPLDLGTVGDTPTAEAFQLVTDQVNAFAEPGPKAIILATDGDPDTCADADDHSQNSQDMSEAAVTAAFGLGISTYVISVGDQVTQSHLQALANAGVGAMGMDAPYYEALNPEGLVNAFDEIIYGVTPCEFEINGTVNSVDAPRGTVVAGGMPLTYGDPDGWDMPTSSTVRLNGAACDAFRQTAGLVDITFPCGTIILQ